ncbi:MAG: LysR family transcriptional regulator [Oscillospiraceae bacterium]|nr:LysR family transcriptional regulator [Oscillospiraceae bacterium]
MELNQLKCFREAARQKNITRAAATLHITQPALSKTINRLEEDLGVRLFERKNKSIELNQYGQAVLEHTEAIFSELDDIRQHIADIQAGGVGEICIGSTLPSSDQTWLQASIRDFILTHQKVRISQHQLSPEALKESLISGGIDIAVGGGFLDCPELQWTELYAERMGILVCAGDPLDQEGTISLMDIKERPFLCNNSNGEMELLTYEICARAGFKPEVRVASNYSGMIGELVSRGLGVAFVPERVFRHQLSSGSGPWEANLRLCRLKEEYCVLRCGVAVAPDRYMTTAAQALYGTIMERRELKQ